MASPPYANSFTSALSPPYPSSSQLPQPPKRRQSDMPSSAPTIKRRKTSMVSMTSNSSAHPLRQTSFPPEMASQSPAYSRSPSIDRMSVMSGSVAGAKKKKPRKSKGKDNDSLAVPGGTPAPGEGGRGRRGGTRDHTEDVEEEDAGAELAVNSTENTREEKLKEERRRHLLTQVFDQEQWARYEAWRSSKLTDATVRRLVNQTLSQSAPQQVILAVKSVAKIFAGDMIESARKVQTEWLEASGESQTTGLPSPPAENGTPNVLEQKRGPLLPDHLREAFRRHVLSNEGLVGELGLWQLQQHSGVERFGTKLGGKRLMK